MCCSVYVTLQQVMATDQHAPGVIISDQGVKLHTNALTCAEARGWHHLQTITCRRQRGGSCAAQDYIRVLPEMSVRLLT